MAQQVDLYTILMLYANKRHSPYIDINPFLAFLEKYANRVSPERPEWKKWTSDVTTKFHIELPPLIEAQKCELLDNSRRILMVEFYAERISPVYKDIENTAGDPFPDASSLGIDLPDEDCRILNIKDDIAEYMEKPQTSIIPVIKMVFPDNIPPALVLGPIIPRPLLDAALLKIRNFLRTQNNMSFFQRRLLPQMQGKENLLKDMLNMLDKRPLDCILQIQNFTELIYLFWVSFCSAVKNELRKKQDFLTTDIAAFQSVYIIETFSTLFKETATVKREKEKALKILEDIMDRPPFLYTLDEIFHFTDITGRPLLGLYTEDDLKAFLNSRSTVENTTELPPLLIYRNKEGEQIFVNKQKVFALCVRLSAEARNQVKKAIGTRWLRLLQDFNNEPAMENDEDFDQLLSKYTLHFVPSLIYILRDKRTFIIQCEAERSQEAAFTTRFYNRNGTLLPMGTLLMLNRKAILTDVRIVLPIWYSIPILSAIFAFFKHLARGGKKPNLPKEFSLPVKEKPQSQEEAVKAAAAQIIQKLSHNKSPEAAMAELERKWHTLLDKQAKQHLITDIKSLVRDRLRRTLRLKLGQKISANTFEDLAVTIYAEAPALKQLGDAESITNYIKLYIAKLLLTIRF